MRLACVHLIPLLLAGIAVGVRAEGPRLFATPDRLAAVRAAVQAPGSHHAEAFAAMKARVEKNDFTVYGGDAKNSNYARSWLVREAALAYLITGDARYAAQAHRVIVDMYEKPGGDNRLPHRGYGLSRAMTGLALAFGHDWCGGAWTEAQRAFVQAKADEALQAWTKYGHANLGDAKASNWVAVCRGGELLLMLGVGEEKARADRYQRLKRDLRVHMRNGFGDLGVSQEGIGYTEYPGAFLLPACYAAADLGDTELMEEARKHAWWKLAMYTHNFQPHDRKVLQTGVAHSSNYDEGWASLLLNHAPPDRMPYVLWWYDRHMGRLAPGAPRDKFDADRAGTTWSLLYYPTDVQPKDPTGVFPVGVADQRGYYFFRNRWKDANDLQASLMADTVHHGHAWDQPEVFALNLMGFHTRFIGGPGKSRDDALYSTLLVDGKYNIKDSVKKPGRKVHFEAGPGEAYALVGGGALYEALGCAQAERHMFVKMSPAVGLLATLDRAASDGPSRTWTWQANLGSEKDDGGVTVTAATESGRPTFLIKGRDGWVKGWVLSPADAEIKTGDPFRIETKGPKAEIWVVLLAGQGAPPAARIAGDGLDSTLTVGGGTVRYDAASNRIKAE